MTEKRMMRFDLSMEARVSVAVPVAAWNADFRSTCWDGTDATGSGRRLWAVADGGGLFPPSGPGPSCFGGFAVGDSFGLGAWATILTVFPTKAAAMSSRNPESIFSESG